MRVLVTDSDSGFGPILIPYLKNNQIEVVPKDAQDIDAIAFVNGSHEELVSLLEAAKDMKGLKQFLFLSCPINSNLMAEYDRLSPHNMATAAYSIGELTALGYMAEFDVPVVIVRSVFVFGEGQTTQSMVPRLVGAALAGNAIGADASCSRQWIPVTHLCEFVNYVVTSNYIPPGAILHATGTLPISDLMLAHTVLSLLGEKAAIFHEKTGHRGGLTRTDETDRYGCPEYDPMNFIPDLTKVVEHYRRQYGSN